MTDAGLWKGSHLMGTEFLSRGCNPQKDKVKSEASTPTGTSELKVYLGMLTYYDKFYLPGVCSGTALFSA